MIALLVAAVLVAAPTHRMLILTGGKTDAEAEAMVKKVPQAYRIPGYPRILKSDGVDGLKPGFVLAVMGTCKLTDAGGVLALERVRQNLADSTSVAATGAYYRDVVWTDDIGCPRPVVDPIVVQDKGPLRAWLLGNSTQVFALAAAPSDGPVQILDPAPAQKKAGTGATSCALAYGEKPQPRGDGLEIRWWCEFPGTGCSTLDSQEVIETVTVKDGKLARAFATGKFKKGQCD